MKRDKPFFAGLLILTFFFTQIGCKTSEKAADSTQSVPAEAQATTWIPTWHISYFSIAYGIDYENLKELEAMLVQFQAAQSVQLTIEKVGWGREGEVDVCIGAEKLTETQKMQLEEEIKGLIIKGKNVRMEKNKPCRR